MDKLRKTLIGLSALMLIFSVFTFPACALEASRIELVTDSGEYKKGELVKAQIHIYNAEFNTAGFALDYDTSVMGAVTAAGTDSSVAGQLISLHDQYDSNDETGTFSALTRTADTENGVITAVFYVNSAVGKSVTAGENGMLVAEITFKMIADGEPAVKFTTIEDSVDFSDTAGLIINNGVKQTGARAIIKYGTSQTQNLDITSPQITEPANSIQTENESTGTDNSNDRAASVNQQTIEPVATERAGEENIAQTEVNSSPQSQTPAEDANSGQQSSGGNEPAALTIAIAIGISAVVLLIAVAVLLRKIRRKKND